MALTTTLGVFRAQGDAAFEQLSAVPGATEQQYLSQVWGFGPDDIWVAANKPTEHGYEGSLVHFDGHAWATVWPATGAPTPGCEITPGVRGMWGTDGELFFHTQSGVYRYRDGAIETFFDAGCDPNVRILSLWGNSSTEVYAALQSMRTHDDCVTLEVLRFDGQIWGPLGED